MPPALDWARSCLGLSVMALLGTIVLTFQALLLAHGGLTTLGAGAFISMAIVGPWWLMDSCAERNGCMRRWQSACFWQRCWAIWRLIPPDNWRWLSLIRPAATQGDFIKFMGVFGTNATAAGDDGFADGGDR